MSKVTDDIAMGIRQGFTLIEVVMVVSLIALLAGVTIGIGASMADSGRKRATEGVLQVLDGALNEYINQVGSIPPGFVWVDSGSLNQEVVDIVGADEDALYPAIDGVLNELMPSTGTGEPDRHFSVNSIGLFLVSIGGATDVEGFLSSVDSKLVMTLDIPGDLQPDLLTVFDGWGNPIRYVHPKFDGIIEDSVDASTRRQLGEPGDFLDVFDPTLGMITSDFRPTDSQIPFLEVRRNRILRIDQEEARANAGMDYPVESDSDGGVCPAQRPYFYSSGPDGDPSTIEDNIYTTKPEYLNPF